MAAGGHDLQMQPFGSDSLQQILWVRQGQAFMLFLWSANCADCSRQYALLREVARSNPRVPLLLVSTDGAAAATAGHELEAFGLHKEDLWTYATANSVEIRRAIDSRWDGRLPRTYLYDASHARQAITGNLDRGRILGWLRQVHAVH
jgi:hypothetical protein